MNLLKCFLKKIALKNINKIVVQLILVFLFFQVVSAQKEKDSLVMNLNLKFGNQSLKLNKNFSSKNDTLQINLFKFYLSGIEIEFNDKSTFVQKNSYHLIDIENPNSFQIPICKKNNKIISKIKFNIGVDSLASVSGALAGDLDLQNGMYWAWQSGYINMKIEGKSSSCITRKNEFQFHIGGYIKPNYAMRTIELKVNKNDLILNLDLEKLFSEISLKETNSIMIPGENAIKMANLSVKMFSVE